MAEATSTAAGETYEPPSFLITSTNLSRDALVRQYTAFKSAIQYAAVAPELVFERIISSIAEAYSAGRETEDRRPIQPGDTIGPSLERIEAMIQALRDELITRDNLATENGTEVGIAVRHLLEQFRLDMSVTRTLPASINTPRAPATDRVVMRLRFVKRGKNRSVLISPDDSTRPFRVEDYLCGYTICQFPDAQFGTINANLDDEDPVTTKHQQKFSPVFQLPPTVTCWLTGFHALALPYRARVRATNITARGFTLNIEPATTRGISVSWVAGFPADKIGEFDIHGSGAWAATPLVSKGYKVTGQRTDTRLAIAITQLDIGGAPEFPVTLAPQLVNGCDYFTWSLNAGDGDRGLYLMKGVYMYA